MSELRQDPCTRDWVVIAPERSRRPHFPGRNRAPTPGAARCPFCPGHESDTPLEVWRVAGPSGHWRVRVVPNRFPMLEPGGSPRRHVSETGMVSMAGIGRHEVIVESPDHQTDLAYVNVADVRNVLEAYRSRYRALRSETRGVILIFRNHGVGAGTSISHPHSQIVATPVVPTQIRHRFEVAMQHYDDLGTCLYLDIADRETRDGRRVVLQTADYLAFQPFASAVPHETWIMPRLHQPSFGDCSDAALDGLASALRSILAALCEVLHDPDYNLIVHSAPAGDEQQEYFIWHIRIIPRISTPAGFELGSGMAVNPTCPEDTAAELRSVISLPA